MTIVIKTKLNAALKRLPPNITTKIKRRLIRVFDQIVSLPAQITWGLSKFSLIEEDILYLLYQKALTSHKNKSKDLDKNDQEIVDELEKNGIYITSLKALGIPTTVDFLKNAQDIISELKNKALLPNNNRDEVHASKAHLMSHPAIFRWGLNDRLLNIVEQYLGLPVAYDGTSCFLSIPNGKEIGARAWHRDREDRRMIKICVYLSDVDEDSGPFQCLLPDLNATVCHSITHRYKSIFDQEMEQFFRDPSVKEQIDVTGQAGTVIFVDTARFYHRGKPPTQNPRTAVFFSYFSRRPWHPFFCQRTPIAQKEALILTQNLSAHQQDCASWQKDLPSIIKWIPKSRI